MSKHNILFIDLDTHKTFTEVAYIEDQRGAKPIHLGTLLSDTSRYLIKPPIITCSYFGTLLSHP
jgi:hypothetical protein